MGYRRCEGECEGGGFFARLCGELLLSSRSAHRAHRAGSRGGWLSSLSRIGDCLSGSGSGGGRLVRGRGARRSVLLRLCWLRWLYWLCWLCGRGRRPRRESGLRGLRRARWPLQIDKSIDAWTFTDDL